jgi:hypothetical protein
MRNHEEGQIVGDAFREPIHFLITIARNKSNGYCTEHSIGPMRFRNGVVKSISSINSSIQLACQQSLHIFLERKHISPILESLCVRASVEVLSDACFCDIRKLSSLTFETGSKLRAIPRDAFRNSPSLKSLVRPASVEELHPFSFISSSIEEIGVDEGNPYYFAPAKRLVTYEGMVVVRYFATKKPRVPERVRESHQTLHQDSGILG